MNVITSGLKKGGAKSTVLCYPPVQNPMTKKKWRKCEISQSGWKFKLGPGVGVKCSISEFWPEQDTAMGVARRWRSFGVGIGRFFQARPRKELAFWISVKMKRFMGLSMKVKIQRKCRKWLRNNRGTRCGPFALTHSNTSPCSLAPQFILQKISTLT